MPEPINNPEQPTTPPTAPAATPAVGENTSTFDISKLDKTAWEQIYQSDRFKELIEVKNEYKQLKAEKAEREKKELEQKGEYEKLAQLAQKERDEARTEAQKLRLDTAIERAAIRAGAVDPDAVLALINRGTIKLDEAGNPTGIQEAIQALQTEKAYLFGKGSSVTLGSPTNPNNANSGKQFKLSQMSNAAFYRENEQEILLAHKEGRIIDDLPR